MRSTLPHAAANVTGFVIAALVAVLIAGCCSKQAPPPQQVKQPYPGPTLTMAEVVGRVNANNQQVPTLWAHHNFKATVFDEHHNPHFVYGDGALLYKRPRDMLLVANNAVTTIFQMGSTEDRYWLKIVPEVDTMWWGSYAHLGDAGTQRIPIRPDLVLEVLGVGTFDTDFTRPPAPVMRFNNEEDAYVFVWTVPAASPARWAALKEIWYDRQTLLPRLVKLYDANGRVVLRAELGGHQAVDVPDVAKDQQPKVATDYRLVFPDTGTTMWFQLDDVRLCNNGSPCRRGIHFPDLAKAGVAKVIDLDQVAAK